ncbi:hypothetical protein OsJ_10585 [Oryza sativa Japonica Group]|uniref:Uncharacterized protein n=2 Tax=Oryza sativa subsp. japonica TaxID=39947 RepID=A0A8J8XMM3_ORYSJ|nr:hypothetical protein LOC_Os03g19640 [Oryza sativa Japonica Group]EAZ26681.1 hypothetical protein OsJ_10585 [Oryza sativa Japonica Group]
MGSHASVSIAFRVMLVMVDEDVELWEALEKGDVTVEAKLDGVEYRTMELSKEDRTVEFIAQVTNLIRGERRTERRDKVKYGNSGGTTTTTLVRRR